MEEKNNTPAPKKSEWAPINLAQSPGDSVRVVTATKNQAPAIATPKLRFKRSALDKVFIVDTDFVLVFTDGSKVLIKDGALRATLEKEYKIGFGETEILGSTLFDQARTADASVASDALPWTALPMNFGPLDPALQKTEATSIAVTVAAPSLGIWGLAGAGLALIGLASGGGGGGNSATTGPASAFTSVGITPMAGPFVTDNEVIVFDMSGNRLTTGRLSAGKVTLNLPANYKGMVMIQVLPSPNGQDYMDETTGQKTTLAAKFGLRAFVMVDPAAQNTATISPLTELAVRHVVGDKAAPTASSPVVTADAQKANQNVGLLVGLSDITGKVVHITNADGTLNTAYTGDSNNTAQVYGKVLAQLSGLITATYTLEDQITTLVPLVNKLQVGIAKGDTVAQSDAKTSALDQLALGAKLVAQSNASLATSLLKVEGQTQRVLLAPIDVVQAAIKTSQEKNKLIGDGFLNAAEETQAMEFLVGLPSQVQAGDQISVKLKYNNQVVEIFKTTITASQAATNQCTVQVDPKVWGSVPSSSTVNFEATVSATGLSSVSYPAYLVKAISYASGAALTVDHVAPNAPTGDLSIESQATPLKTTTSGASTTASSKLTQQQTPLFSGTFNNQETGAVLVFNITSANGDYQKTWRSDEANSPITMDASTGRWQLRVPDASKLPFSPEGLSYSVKVQLIDAAGNASEWSSLPNVIAQLSAVLGLDPSSDTLTVGDSITKAVQPVLYGKAPSSMVKIEVDLNGVTYSTSKPQSSGESISLYASGEFSVLAKQALTDGTYTPKVRLYASLTATEPTYNFDGTPLTVDIQAPTLSVSGWPDTFKATDSAELTFTFSEALGTTLQWNATTQTGDLTVKGGTLGNLVQKQVLSDGRVSYTAVFTPTQGATGTAEIQLSDGRYTDKAGNGGAGFSKTANFNTQQPTINTVTFEAVDAQGQAKQATLTPDDVVRIKVKFNDTIEYLSTANSKASFAFLLDGNALRLADYASGSGTSELVFEYKVALGDSDRTGGLTAQANALLVPQGATLKNAFGNAAVVTTAAIGAGSNSIMVDGVLPEVSITRDDSNVLLNKTSTAQLRLNFSEDPGSSFDLASDVTVVGGTLSKPSQKFTNSDGTFYYTCTFTPDMGRSADATVSIAASTVADLAGNRNARSAQLTLRVDTVDPVTPSGYLQADSDTGWDAATRNDSITNQANPRLTGTGPANATVYVTVDLGDGNTWVGSTRSTDKGLWDITIAAPLGNGTYSPQVRVVTDTGNQSMGVVRAFTVDVIPPDANLISGGLSADSFNDTGISASDGLTKNATPWLKGLAEAGSRVEVQLSDRSYFTTATAQGWDINTAASSTQNLADGTYVPVIRVTDKAGNTTVKTGTSFTIDTQLSVATSASLDGGSDSGNKGDSRTSVTQPQFNGTAESGAAVEFTIDGKTYQTTATNGTWSITVGNSQHPDHTLAQGSYAYTVKATDTAGNTQTVTYGGASALIIQTQITDPTLVLSNDTGNGVAGTSTDLWTADTRLTVGGLSSDAIRTQFKISVNGTSTAWLSESEYNQAMLSNPDGQYTVNVRQTNSTGVSSPGEARITFTKDTHADAISLVLTNDTAGTGVGTTSDLITSDGRLTPINPEEGATVQYKIGAGNWANSYAVSDLGADGTKTVQVRQVDQAGNVSEAQTLQFTLDTTAPLLQIRSDRSTLTAGDTATITFTFSEDPGTGFTDSDLVVTGGSLSALVKDSINPLIYTATFTPTSGSNTVGQIALQGAANGDFTDAAGNANAAVAALSLPIYTQRPTVRIDSTASSLKAGQTTTVTFTFSNDPGSSFNADDVVTVGGQLSNWSAKLGDGTVGNLYRYTATFTPSTDYQNNASITVVPERFQDANGNSNDQTATSTISVDTLPPTVTIDGLAAVSKLVGDTGGAPQTSTITFTFSEDPGSSFTWDASAQTGDISVTGGTLGALSSKINNGNGTYSYTATFTPSTGTGIAQIKVVSGNFSDPAGNTNATDAQQSGTLDTVRPTVALSTATSTLNKVGATATVTFDFSEAPGTSFGLNDVQVVGGSLSNLQLVTGTSGKQYTATFTPQARFAGTGTLTLGNSCFQDAVGNVNQDGADANNSLSFGINTIPTVTITNLADNASTANKVTLLGTAEASTVLGNITIQVYDGNTLLGSTTTDYMGTWAFTTPTLSTGAHTLKVVQANAGGNNSSQASKTITVGTSLTAPQLTAIDGLQISTMGSGTNRLTTTVAVDGNGGAAVAFFAKVDDLAIPTGQFLLGGMENFHLFYGGDQRLYLWSSANIGAVSFTPDTNWHHYAIVHDGAGNANLYIDGVLRLTKTGADINFTSLGLPFGNHGAQSRGLNGSMRDIKVFDVNLTQAEVQKLYQGQATGQESQLKAAYALLGNTTATTGPALTVTGTMTAHATDSGVLGDNIINSTAPILVGQASAGATVEIWDTTISGTNGRLATVTADSTGSWSANLVGQAPGLRSYVAKQLNADNSVANTSSATSITIDTTPPGAPSAPVMDSALDTNTVGDNITSKNILTFSGTADADAWVSVLQSGSLVGKVQAGADGRWSFATLKAVADGTYAFTTKQEDAAGNLSAASTALNVTVDTAAAAPAFAYQAGTSAQYILVKQTGASLNQMYLNEIEVYSGGVNVARNGTVTASTYSSFDGFPAAGVINGSLERNSNNGYAARTATTDNWIQIDLGASYFIDAVKLYALSPGEGALAKYLDVFASSSSLSALTSSELLADGSGAVRLGGTGASPTYVTTLTFGSVPTSQPSFTGTGEAGATIELTDTTEGQPTVLGTSTVNSSGVWGFKATSILSGTHSITAKQTDLAGNISAASSPYTFTVKIDRMGLPTMAKASDSGIAGDGITNLPTPTLTGATVTSGGEVQIFDGTILLGTTLANDAGIWTFIPPTPLAGSASGTLHTITAKDSTTGQTSSAMSLTIDTSAAAPVFSDAVPASSKTAPVISGSGAEANATVILTAKATDGTTQTFGTKATGSGAWSIDTGSTANNQVALATSKTWFFSATQSDSAGNTSEVRYALSTPVLNAAQDTGIVGDNITSNAAPTLFGQAAAGATVAIWDTFNNKSSPLATVTADSTGAWRADLSNQAHGVHNYEARQLNADGSLAQKSSATAITIDTTPPLAPTTVALYNDSSGTDLVTMFTPDTRASGTPWSKSDNESNLGTTNGPSAIFTDAVVYRSNGYPAGDFVRTDISFEANTTYQISVWAKLVSGTLGSGQIINFANAATVAIGGLTSQWKLFSMDYTTGSTSGIDSLYLNVNKNTKVDIALWGAQMVVKSSAGDNITKAIPAALNVTPAEAGGSLWYSWDGGQTYASNYVAPTIDGTYTVHVRQQDAAGNNGAAKALTFTLDTKADAPTVVLGSGVSDGATSAEATAATGVLTLTAESGASTVVRFSRTGGGTGGGTVTKTVMGDGANPVAVVLTSADLATLGNGSISVSAVATDKAGNKSTSTNLSFNLNTSTTPPVVIDLNRDGAIGYSHVVMDVNGDGQLDHTAWVGPNDGLLVWDKYLDGMVRSPSQFVFATQAGQTDLQGLAAQFDTNQDGVFDAKDALFGEFAVWQDRNQNGASDAGEVRSLADWGIQSIALQSDGTVRSPAMGVHEAGRSSTTNTDGTKMLVADASFDFATLTGVAVSSAVHGQVDLASDASANVLRVSLQDVLAQPAPNLFNASNTSTISGTGLNGTKAKHQLMVRGEANDFAQVSNLSTDWSPTDTVVACDSQSYSVYNAKTSDAQLLIDLRMVNASHVL